MWARVNIYEVAPENIDAADNYLREDALPKARQQSGYRGHYSLMDPESGKGMAITLWDSEADLRASEASAEQQRQGGTKRTGLTMLGVERCQVLFDELV